MGLRFSILGLNQEEVLKIKKTVTKKIRGIEKQVEIKLDVVDLLLINHIADYPNRKKVTKIIIDDNYYFWVSYSQLINELPILDIKKQALSDRLNKLVELNILEKKIHCCDTLSNMTLFRMTDAYENLKYKPSNSEGSSETQGVSYSTTTGYRSQIPDVNNNIDNNINNKEISTNVDTKKEKTLFDKFNDWLAENAPNVCKLTSQMSEKQFSTIRGKYSFEQISHILLQMENYKGIQKKYTSVYLTFNNWAKREYGK